MNHAIPLARLPDELLTEIVSYAAVQKTALYSFYFDREMAKTVISKKFSQSEEKDRTWYTIFIIIAQLPSKETAPLALFFSCYTNQEINSHVTEHLLDIHHITDCLLHEKKHRNSKLNSFFLLSFIAQSFLREDRFLCNRRECTQVYSNALSKKAILELWKNCYVHEIKSLKKEKKRQQFIYRCMKVGKNFLKLFLRHCHILPYKATYNDEHIAKIEARMYPYDTSEVETFFTLFIALHAQKLEYLLSRPECVEAYHTLFQPSATRTFEKLVAHQVYEFEKRWYHFSFLTFLVGLCPPLVYVSPTYKRLRFISKTSSLRIATTDTAALFKDAYSLAHCQHIKAQLSEQGKLYFDAFQPYYFFLRHTYNADPHFRYSGMRHCDGISRGNCVHTFNDNRYGLHGHFDSFYLQSLFEIAAASIICLITLIKLVSKSEKIRQQYPLMKQWIEYGIIIQMIPLIHMYSLLFMLSFLE